MADLFAGLGAPDTAATPAANAPLADRLRPTRLADVVGQEHLTAADGAIGRMIAGGRLSSMILWGPPGVGKTTISRLIAREAGYDFMQLSAVTTGLADLRKAIATAAALHTATNRSTADFIDELHRFSRPVQDAMLPALEDGTFTLIGATTENPSFSLVSALLSRAKVFTLKRLSEDDLEQVIARAERHFDRPLPLLPIARGALIGMADGDARYLLGLCEELFALHADQPLDVAQLADIVQARAPLYDKGQEEHFNMLSSFHKSLRGSDVDAAMYWAARMLGGGEDPAVIFRRLQCAASEDVGMADPQAMVQVMTAWQAFERTGLPEGRLFLAQAIAYVATAPKSNAAYLAFDQAAALARKTGSLPPPKHILNAPTALMKELGYHDGYQYDHDRPDAFSGQEFYPDEIAAADPEPLYAPNERGFEREIRKRLAFWSARRKSGR